MSCYRKGCSNEVLGSLKQCETHYRGFQGKFLARKHPSSEVPGILDGLVESHKTGVKARVKSLVKVNAPATPTKVAPKIKTDTKVVVDKVKTLAEEESVREGVVIVSFEDKAEIVVNERAETAAEIIEKRLGYLEEHSGADNTDYLTVMLDELEKERTKRRHLMIQEKILQTRAEIASLAERLNSYEAEIRGN
jgi:hypothetical protein